MVGDLITFSAIGALLGGRLGYVIFYSPDLLWKFKGSFPFWGVFAVHEGGMASHGGIVGVVLALVWYAKKNRISLRYSMDVGAVAGTLGISFGRIANFINGELVGRKCALDFPLGVRFPSDLDSIAHTNPTKLLDLTPAISVFNQQASDQWAFWVESFSRTGQFRFEIYSTLQELVRTLQATGDERIKAALMTVLDPRHPSQLYAAVSEGLLTFIVCLLVARKDHKAGVVGATGIVVYALARIGNEFFREPDAHIGFQLFNLTRGQWLSLAMLLLGLGLLVYWSKASSKFVPGWQKARGIHIHRRK
jgi:phosphatidylglycerol:prolipoprotein diacylglycerol transferase